MNAARGKSLDDLQVVDGLILCLFAATAAEGRGYYPLGYQGPRPKGFWLPHFLRAGAKSGTPKKVAEATSQSLTSTPPFSAKPGLQQQLQPINNEKGNTKMSKRKNPPNESFRRSQVVSPVPSGRRFGKAKTVKQTFDIYVSDIETGDETLAITVFAPTQREAIQMAKARLQSSPVLRNITHVAFTAVKVEGD
jgi:hypothetical protein